MTDSGYQRLDTRVMKLYREQDYAAAYDLLTAEGPSHPEHEVDVYYMRSCLASRQGKHDLAVQLIADALEGDIWFGQTLMRRTPSWQVLQGLPEFERLAAISMARQQRAGQAVARHVALVPKGRMPPYRGIVALHGNGDNARSALAGWSSVVDEGWLLAAVQSSQIVRTDGYVWDDTETALREVREQHATLGSEHELSADDLIVAGFSMGGETALRVALTGTIPARAFILLGPGGPDTDRPDSWLPLIHQQRARGVPLRGYLVAGQEDDVAPIETLRALAGLLTENGIPCGFEVVPGLAHEYPPDFRTIIQRALAFTDRD